MTFLYPFLTLNYSILGKELVTTVRIRVSKEGKSRSLRDTDREQAASEMGPKDDSGEEEEEENGGARGWGLQGNQEGSHSSHFF